jgi:hypothetical protein
VLCFMAGCSLFVYILERHASIVFGGTDPAPGDLDHPAGCS